MSQFKDRIEEAQKALDTAKTDVAELMGIAESEERDLSDVESEQLTAYAEQIEASEKRIETLELAEKALAQKVVEKQAPAIAQAQHLGNKKRDPGELIFGHADTGI